MSNLFSAFATATIVFSFVANAAAGPPRTATARDGVLSLRNGQIIRGNISLLGDRFVIALPKGGQIRVPVHDVELEAKNLGEIYDFKRAKMLHPRPDDHMRLAHWCLNHHLVLRAMQEVEEAKRKGGSPHLVQIERRLKSAMREPRRNVATKASGPKRRSTDELQQLVKQVSPEQMQRFTHGVQPILLNRCSGCHGYHTKREFKLHRPMRGRPLPQRLTLENLRSALAIVDRRRPLESSLLKQPMTSHGFMASPVFKEKDKSHQMQLTQLREWVVGVTQTRLTPQGRNRALAKSPAAIPKPNSFLLQSKKAAFQTGDATAGTNDRVQPAVYQPAGASQANTADPYDPSDFNQRFHRSRRSDLKYNDFNSYNKTEQFNTFDARATPDGASANRQPFTGQAGSEPATFTPPATTTPVQTGANQHQDQGQGYTPPSPNVAPPNYAPPNYAPTRKAEPRVPTTNAPPVSNVRDDTMPTTAEALNAPRTNGNPSDLGRPYRVFPRTEPSQPTRPTAPSNPGTVQPGQARIPFNAMGTIERVSPREAPLAGPPRHLTEANLQRPNRQSGFNQTEPPTQFIRPADIQPVNRPGEKRWQDTTGGFRVPRTPDHQVSGPPISGHQVSGHQVSGHQVSGHQVSGHQVSGHQVSGHQVSGRQPPRRPRRSSGSRDILKLGSPSNTVKWPHMRKAPSGSSPTDRTAAPPRFQPQDIPVGR